MLIRSFSAPIAGISLALMLLLTLTSVWADDSSESERKQPNILLITSDQHRPDCFGFASRGVQTPNLDRLAAEAGQHTQVTGSEDGARMENLGPLSDVVAGVADVVAYRHLGQQVDIELKLQAKGVTAQVDITSGDDAVVNTSSASLGSPTTACRKPRISPP